MPSEITLANCLTNFFRELFPTLEWSRVHFYLGLPWPYSQGDQAAMAMPGGNSRIDIFIPPEKYKPCDDEQFVLTIGHELVHALQIQSSLFNGKGIGLFHVFTIKCMTCWSRHWQVSNDQNGGANNRIASITVNSTTVLDSVLYDPFGPARQWEWGNSTLTAREFDQDGLVDEIDSAGLKTYAQDDAFRITGITDAVNSALSWTHGYDLLDRLTSASRTGLSQTWTYDTNGNRLTRAGPQVRPSRFHLPATGCRVSAVRSVGPMAMTRPATPRATAGSRSPTTMPGG